MRLKNRLFFSTAFFCTLALLFFYLISLFFLKSDFSDAMKKIGSIFFTQNQKERDQEILLIKERILEEKAQLDALFLLFAGENFELKWSYLTSLLAAHPDIGFLQAHEKNEGTVFSLIPSKVSLYPATTFAMNDHFFFVLLPTLEKTEK